MKGLLLNRWHEYGISTNESSSKFNFEHKCGWKTYIRPNRPYSEVKTILSVIRESAEKKKRQREVENEIASRKIPERSGESDRDHRRRTQILKEPRPRFLFCHSVEITANCDTYLVEI